LAEKGIFVPTMII